LRIALLSILACALISTASQVLVVDDDSTDNTEEVARGLGVRYMRVATHHPSLTRNAGLDAVDSEYVAFLDDDDAWLPENMGPQLEALQSNPDAGFAYGVVQGATEDLEPLDAHWPGVPLASGHVPEQLHLAYPQLGVVLFRRQAVVDVGGFDPAIPYQQDADLMLRVAAMRDIIGVNVVGMLYRQRRASRKRSDYFWGVRHVTGWWPRGQGVGWRSGIRFMLSTRGLFFSRFLEDADACLADRDRGAVWLSLWRAVLVSPLHAMWHTRRVMALGMAALRIRPAT
jgi:glycosyltransferase involved in cell wall biosynthesis